MTKHEVKSREETGRALRPAQAAPVRRGSMEESAGCGQAQGVEPSQYDVPIPGLAFAADDAAQAH